MMSYAHIPQHCASLVNAFCAEFLNPYVNFHRPCFFPETITDARGEERKKYRYKDMMTPYEKLKSTPNASQYLKAGVTFEQMDAQATEMSDNDAALALNNARIKLFKDIAAAMKKTGLRNEISNAKRRSTYELDRIRTKFNYSDSKPFVQTRF